MRGISRNTIGASSALLTEGTGSSHIGEPPNGSAAYPTTVAMPKTRFFGEIFSFPILAIELSMAWMQFMALGSRMPDV